MAIPLARSHGTSVGNHWSRFSVFPLPKIGPNLNRKKSVCSSSSSSIPPPPANSKEAAFEENVRRYLMRKPMTTTELLKKFKSKKTGLAKDELMPGLFVINVSLLTKLLTWLQKMYSNSCDW